MLMPRVVLSQFLILGFAGWLGCSKDEKAPAPDTQPVAAAPQPPAEDPPEAQLAEARSLATSGKHPEALELAEKIIGRAPELDPAWRLLEQEAKAAAHSHSRHSSGGGELPYLESAPRLTNLTAKVTSDKGRCHKNGEADSHVVSTCYFPCKVVTTPRNGAHDVPRSSPTRLS